MKIKPTNSELEILVDPEDYDRINSRKWVLLKGGYAACQARKPQYINGQRYTLLLHREVLNLVKGDGVVDHINGNKLDCRKSNLRKCSSSQNSKNMKKPKNNISGFKGVSFRKDRNYYVVQIMSNGKAIRKNCIENAEEAARIYDKLAIELHEEFANLNFPSGGSYF